MTPVSAPASTDAAKAQSVAEGTVLVTDNLDIDFSKHLITFIELGADKCIPCKAMQPIMKEIAAEYKGQVQVIFYDVWKNPEPGRKYGIQLIPTQVFIDKNGQGDLPPYRVVPQAGAGRVPEEERRALSPWNLFSATSPC